MADLLQALIRLRPGVQCTNVDGTLAGFRWHEPLPEDFAPPTQAEVDAEIARLDVIEKRLRDYPPVGDQLDAIWKGGTEAEAMKAQIEEVKTDHPLPVKAAREK